MLKKLYLPKLAFQMKLKFYRYHIFIVMALGLFLNSCVSRQKVVYFENAQELNSSILAADATVRIKPNDAITIRVNAPEQAAAMPFNLTKSLAVGTRDLCGRTRQHHHVSGIGAYQSRGLYQY